MNADLEAEVRERLRSVSLPPAPVGLRDRITATSREPAPGTARLQLGRTARFLVPLVAVLVIGAIAVSGGGLPSPSVQPGGSSSAEASGEPQGPTTATLTVGSRIGEWCSPGGCEFQVELTGPGGPWRGVLDNAELGAPTEITPRLPERLARGSYSMSAEIHVIGDAIYPGESGPRDLGTTATCSNVFEVVPGLVAVQATLGFWLDRCAVGAVLTTEGSAATNLRLQATAVGGCGEFGCDYRAVLTGPGGSWQTVMSSQKPASQLAPGPDLPGSIPPGTYRLEASSHLMSDEPAPGAGHQQELGVAGTCAVVFEVTPAIRSQDLFVAFDGIGCEIGWQSIPPGETDTPEAPPPPEFNCAESGVAARPTCAEILEAVLATLGPNHPPIRRIDVPESCSGGVIPQCARSESVKVTFDRLQVYMTVATGESGPVALFIQPDPGEIPSFGPPYRSEVPSGSGPWIWRADLSEDGWMLTVRFFGRSDDLLDDRCATDYEPWVGIVDGELLVKIVSVPVPRPSPTPTPTPAFPEIPPGVDVFVCTTEGLPKAIDIVLPEPFAGTTIRDLNGGVIELAS